MTGRVVHFEVPVDDLERASAFYREAFGWEMSTIPGLDYTLVQTTASNEDGSPKDPGAINGGMLQRPEGYPGSVITIEVDSIDDAIKRVEKLGGKSYGPGKIKIGDLGYAGYFLDSEGNVIGLWQNA